MPRHAKQGAAGKCEGAASYLMFMDIWTILTPTVNFINILSACFLY